jgi:hypothetical protein
MRKKTPVLTNVETPTGATEHDRLRGILKGHMSYGKGGEWCVCTHLVHLLLLYDMVGHYREGSVCRLSINERDIQL